MIDKILGRSASSGSQSSPSGPAVKGATVESQQKALQSLFHSACGNGRVDSGESCDQGEQNSDFIPNACRTNCTLPLCGDGVTDSVFGEVCDQGLENSNGKPDTCRFACTPPICGDNVHDSNEECDGTPGCDKQCLLSGIDRKQVPCGNGLLDEHEQCDDGNRKAGDGCSLTCQNETSVCGNHILDLGEECDDGNTRDGDFCSRFCVLVRKTCGNGSVDINEQCDEERPTQIRNLITAAKTARGIVAATPFSIVKKSAMTEMTSVPITVRRSVSCLFAATTSSRQANSVTTAMTNVMTAAARCVSWSRLRMNRVKARSS